MPLLAQLLAPFPQAFPVRRSFFADLALRIQGSGEKFLRKASWGEELRLGGIVSSWDIEPGH